MEIKNATFEGWLRDSRGIKTLETSYEAKMVVQTDVSASTVVFNKGTAYEKGNYSMQEGDVKMSDMAVMTILMPILTN